MPLLLTLVTIVPGTVTCPFAEAQAPAKGVGSLEILDRHGARLRTILSPDNTVLSPVRLESVSPWLILATLAAEDRRFFSHPGVDLQAVLRALWQNLSSGRRVSGASTLTQQLVRSLNPRPRSLLGKAREALDALLLEKRLDKAVILEEYLNRVSYGGILQGVEAASRAYFGVPASGLSLGQAAMLAGVAQSPGRYDPARHWGAALSRQRTILRRMRRWGWLDDAGLSLALGERLSALKPEREFLAPHFTEHVRRGLLAGRDGPPAGGSVRTTLDAGLQRELEGILSSHLALLKAQRVSNSALVVLDNASGEVLAWVGSADFADEGAGGQVDGATSLRQPGSSLKPFLYGLALSAGMTASTIILDTPLTAAGGFSPRNYDERFHGPVRLREALANSYNVPAVRVVQEVGVDRFLSLLRAFGLESLTRPADHYGVGLSLGNAEVTLVDLANAYASLARGGVWKPVRTLARRDGAAPSRARRVMSRESSFIVADILSDNMARAAAFGLNSPLHLPFPFASKTGTTKDYRDNWAVGFTPAWTIGVWAGNFDGEPMRRVSGITGAAPVLRDAAIVMHHRFGSRPFERPVGIREVEICPVSGLPAGHWCPETMVEIYAKGRLPKGTCRTHGAPVAAQAGDPPAPVPDAAAPAIEFPNHGDVFAIDPASPLASQALRLQTHGACAPAGCTWWVDGRRLEGSGSSAWWPLRPGRHTARLSVSDGHATRQSRQVSFLVLAAQP